VLVVSSKSGSTVETDSHRRVFAAAFAAAGLDPAAHLVVVTDPGSPLQRIAEEQGYRAVITAEPNVGGRYSALTAFGLVPAGLARADIASLLDDAEQQAPSLGVDDPTNPALRLAAALAVGHAAGAEKVVLADTGSGIVGFADWAEQLIAESTGKNGTGIIPIAGEPLADDTSRIEGKGHDSALGAAANHMGTGAFSQHKSDGTKDHRFSRSRLTGKNRGAGREFNLRALDEPVILDDEAAQHANRRTLPELFLNGNAPTHLLFKTREEIQS